MSSYPTNLADMSSLETWSERVALKGTRCDLCVSNARNYAYRNLWDLQDWQLIDGAPECPVCLGMRVVPIPYGELRSYLLYE